jgi:peroxiredoxin
MMRRQLSRSLVFVWAVLSGSACAGPKATVATTAAQPAAIPDFQLVDARDNSTVHFAELNGKGPVVVAFVGTECLLSNLYIPRLAELQRSYAARGVQFVAINSNTQDDAKEVAAQARRLDVPFAMLKDDANRVADSFGAKRTPEVFLVDRAGRVRYSGRIDDQYGFGYRGPKPTQRYLADAIDSVLDGRAVAAQEVASVGCTIGRAPVRAGTGKITYREHIAPIVAKHCADCHQPGRVAPMSLRTYSDVRSWSAMIGEVVADNRMPPWFPDPRFGDFENARGLSDSEKKDLLQWIANGTPEGDGPAPALPPSEPVGDADSADSTTWEIGKPDAVFTMAEEFTVPASAPPPLGIPYRYWTIPTDFPQDMWIVAGELKPGHREVVHHAAVGLQYPGETDTKKLSLNVWRHGTLGYAPGKHSLRYPEGTAKRLPKGSRIVVEIHYTPNPNGRETRDRSSLGFVFAKQPPRRLAVGVPAIDPSIRIPAGNPNYQSEITFSFKRDCSILSLSPHMHTRGKDSRIDAIAADGKVETLLSVPRYDFNWQDTYEFKNPRPMKAGDKLRIVNHFDNSASNRNNPDPAKDVTWGNQSWDEMSMGVLDLTFDLPTDIQALDRELTPFGAPPSTADEQRKKQ